MRAGWDLRVTAAGVTGAAVEQGDLCDGTGVEEPWSFSTAGGTAFRSLAVAADGSVHLGGQNGVVRKLSAEGVELWRYEGHPNVVDVIVVDKAGGVFTGSRDDTVRRLSSGGEFEWAYSFGAGVYALASDGSGGAYAGGPSRDLARIGASGAELWRHADHGNSVRSIALTGVGQVLSGSGASRVRRTDPDSGSSQELLAFPASNGVHGLGVDGEGVVYAATTGGLLRKADSAGTMLWEVALAGAATSLGVDSASNVYVGGYSDDVEKFAADGTRVWVYSGHAANVNAVAVDAHGHVYTAGNDGVARKLRQTGCQ